MKRYWRPDEEEPEDYFDRYEDEDDESESVDLGDAVTYHTEILLRVIDSTLEEIDDSVVRHEVVNNVLKHVRELSVRFNRESA